MNMRSSRLSAIIGCSLGVLFAGAAVAQSAVEPAPPQLRTYTFSQINTSQYEVVGRLWGDTWRTAYWVLTFPTRGQAMAALNTEAVGRGADGLLNVSCLDQGRWKWSSNTEPAFLCYGIAIRVRPGQG
jgi:hypothetical protein